MAMSRDKRRKASLAVAAVLIQPLVVGTGVTAHAQGIAGAMPQGAPAPQASPPAPPPPPPPPAAGEAPPPPVLDANSPGELPPAIEPGAAGAGTNPDEAALANEPYFNPDELEVIKVTVDRREKRLQDYAGSANAFTQQDLERVGVTSVRELSSTNPSMEIGTQEGNTEIYIRGIGDNNNTELGDPATAVHVDGVYIPRPRGIGSMFYDIERVEVNRGPQGTLRGRNATAGTLNIVTAKPKLKEFAAEGSLQLGNYSQRLAKGMVNIPLGDTLALRFAAFTENRESFYKNATPNSTIIAPESADTLAYRSSLKFSPISALTINIGQDYTQEKGTGYTGSNYQAALLAGVLPNEIPDPRKVYYRGPQPSAQLKHWGVHGTINGDFGPVQLEILASFRDLRYQQTTGGNSGVYYNGSTPGNIDDWGSSYWLTKSKSAVGEIRLYSPDSSRVRWNVGGFGLTEKQYAFLGATVDNSNGYFGQEYNMPDVKDSSLAGFLDATVDLSAILRATAGIRGTHEEKTRNGIGAQWGLKTENSGWGSARFGTEGFAYLADRRDFSNLGPQLNGADPLQTFLSGIQRFGVRDTVPGLAANGGLTSASWGSVTYESGKYKDNYIDYRLGLDADVARGHLVYASLNTGHHSGGFNDNVAIPNSNVAPVAPTYRPESLYAFEVGTKNEFADKKLRLNAAGFLYLYHDQIFQVVQAVNNINDLPPGAVPVGSDPGSTAVRVNAARSTILGAEFDAAYRLPFGLIASVSGMLLRAQFDQGDLFDNRSAYGVVDAKTDPNAAKINKVSVAGNTLPRAPHVTLNYSLQQNIRTSFGWFDWIVTAQTRSKYYMTVFNGNGFTPSGEVNPNLSDSVPMYTRLDAGLGYTRPDGKTRLDVFGNNLTNATYMTTFINTPGLNLRYFNSPRQAGVRMSLYW